MILALLLAGLIGFLGGVLVNALADDLPYRRNPGWPTYPDGTPRSLWAWSGLIAFITGQRAPTVPQPNDARRRLYEGAPRLGWRYPLTEVMMIALGVVTAVAAGYEPDMTVLQFGFWMAYVTIYGLVTVIDIEHKLILFIVVLPSAALALLNVIITPQTATVGTLQNALSGAAVGFVPFFVLYLGGYLFTYIMSELRGERIDTVAFGYGDVMLMTLSGLILGFDRTIFALFITVFLGAFGAFGYLVLRSLLRGRYSLFTAIPYGPYIVAGTLVMLLFGAQVRVALIGY